MNELSFTEISKLNIQRCARWHGEAGLMGWTINDWACAMAGEAGEVCNAAKKLKRVQDGMANKSDPGRELGSMESGLQAIAEEAADTFLYLNLLVERARMEGLARGIHVDTLEQAIRGKFNKTSERYGFPERL